jgi:hypothetical protein
MLTPAELIGVCLTCPNRMKPDARHVSACSIDSRDIREHAHARACPIGRYQLGVGDLLAVLFNRLGVRRVADLWTRLTKRPCDCSGRQAKLNARWAPFYDWLMEWPHALRFNRSA